MAELRILFLAPRIPWPLDTGGKIRTYYLLKALARHHQVRVITFGSIADDGPGLGAIHELGAQCELFPPGEIVDRAIQLVLGLAGPIPYNIRKYTFPRIGQRIRQLALKREVDLLHCDHLHMAPYGPLADLPFVVDEHNVETIIWERFSRDDQEPLHRRLLFMQQAFWLRRVERDLCRRAALILLCSESDERALQLLASHPQLRTKVVPNGVDIEYFSADGPAEGSGHVFFTGSMDWAPNENAVLAFLDEIWPAMRDRLPDLAFYVVGRNPSPRLSRRGEMAGVCVTGTVPDVRPYMRGALALLVPMRVGGGTRLKILEAFAARVPVISTALGIEGIDATPNVHYLRAESAEEFADAASRLREDSGIRRSLVQSAFELASERYSWDAVGDELARAYGQRFV